MLFRSFRSILVGLNRDFYHQTVTTQQIETYISQKSSIDFSKVFDQYLRTVKIPSFRFGWTGNTLTYSWGNVVDGFAMPLRVTVNGQAVMLAPTQTRQTKVFPADIKSVVVDPNFYVTTEQLKVAN